MQIKFLCDKNINYDVKSIFVSMKESDAAPIFQFIH
jgi:hypothetical protein